MKQFTALSGAAVILLFLAVSSPLVAAFENYQNNIPNGRTVVRNGQTWPGVGHENRAGGGARNPFGAAFAAAGRSWTSELCQADTDGDGFTNGQELGDPSCTWTAGGTPSRTTGISHPGYADSTPTTTNAAGTTLAPGATTTAAPGATPSPPTSPAAGAVGVGVALLAAAAASSSLEPPRTSKRAGSSSSGQLPHTVAVSCSSIAVG
eukprot:CAMPEP_0174833118 /NCGR_PEP_ID=MMETSP1114-20130205/4044_1 /TAXON_ID=312471 /ORGANISM="Neobodo designis, Strain CCAP 1951/1" /LENGTH=206 /DNA_ID=CAMNT_0016066989 /DNA_START=97 /DNA_END=715 /DNA_ORIENTATION=+